MVFAAILLFASPAFSRLVNKVDVRTRSTGYEVRVEFFIPMRYISHRPKKKGSILIIQMRPSVIGLNDPETLEQIEERQILSWDRSIPIPLKEMTYEGGIPDRPEMILRFKQDVEFDVRNSADLRTVIILVKVEKPAEPKPEVVPAPQVEAVPPILEMPIPDLSAGDPRLAELMDEAGGAMIDRNFRRAIQIYTKIAANSRTVFRRDAQELLGLARERNKQLAHAKAEYEKYLKLYPEGPGSDRVRQRLSGLLTAAIRPQEKLREPKRPGEEDVSDWNHQVFGSLSEFYSYNDTKGEDGTRTVNQSESITSLDFNTRSQTDRFEIRTQFFGSYEADFRDNGPDDNTRINNLFLDLEDRKLGLFGRFGRQTRSSGGVIGRFDGGVVSYEITPEVKVNGVFGYPVASANDSAFNTDKMFYGANFDLGTFWENWDFNLFVINQEVEGLTDRRSVGGEIRYFHPQRSFFSFVDYDIFYDELNIFLINGGWTFPTKTRVNLVLDYRNSPILTTSNALIGQLTATTIPQLLNSFSEDQIYQLARDRTATSKTATLGIVQDLNENYQLVAEATVTELTGTPTSGGVPGTPATGEDYFYLLQFIANNFIMEGDVNIIELRYANTLNSESYSFNLNLRYPITPNFRVNPRIQTNLRTNKNDEGEQLTLRPLLRVDYRWKNWLRFEVEGGREWREETVLGGNTDRTRGYFVLAGFRAYF